MERSAGVAYLLWLLGLVGIHGVHRFYCGKWITGLIWFFTMGLFFVGWFIDVFLIPSMVRQSNTVYIGTVNKILDGREKS